LRFRIFNRSASSKALRFFGGFDKEVLNEEVTRVDGAILIRIIGSVLETGTVES
jgi:hypothetical protein